MQEGLMGIIERFSNARVAIVGDVMLDEYIHGTISRINPEAPVPILDAEHSELRLGGAGNVAANVHSLSGSTFLAGRVGMDLTASQIREEASRIGIDTLLYEEERVMTPRKTRLVAQSRQQSFRYDWENRLPLLQETADIITSSLSSLSPDIILISDYAKGMVTHQLYRGLLALGVPIVLDPKPMNAQVYASAHLMTPNAKEASEMAGANDVESAARILASKYSSNIAVTCGESGVVFSDTEGAIQHVPSHPRKMYDVVGAGDTFVAAAALSMACGATPLESVRIANMAAGLVVEKPGTATVTMDELLAEVARSKSTSYILAS